MKEPDKSKAQLLKEIEELRYQVNQLKLSGKDENGSEQTLLQSKVLTRSMLNIPTDAVMLVDGQGTLLDVNETTARRFVTFVENLIGTNITETDLQNLLLEQNIKKRHLYFFAKS